MLNSSADLLGLKLRLKSMLRREQGEVKVVNGNTVSLVLKNDEKIEIPQEYRASICAGDRIQACIRSNALGKNFCEPEKLLGKPRAFLAAKLLIRQGVWFASPIGSSWIKWRIAKENYTPELCFSRWKEKDWVHIAVLQHPLEKLEIEKDDHILQWKVELKAWVGHQNDPFLPWKHELIKAGLPCVNPHDLVYAPQLAPPSPSLEEYREDFTDLHFITIDSEETLDIDDAVCVRPVDGKSYELFIAITDVDYVVSEGSMIDKTAQKMGSTVYLPQFSVSMLPQMIAQNQSSLVINQRRAAIVLKTLCDRQTHEPVQRSTFHLCWICVKEKCSFEMIEARLNKIESFSKHDNSGLIYLWKFAQNQLFKRSRRINLSIENCEYQYDVNDMGKVIGVFPKKRLLSEKMIESLMLYANQVFCEYVTERDNLGVIFSSHPGFSERSLPQLVSKLSKLGIEVLEEFLKSSEGFVDVQNFLQALGSADLKNSLHYSSSALLNLKVTPHRALGLDAYATWTSPLRKYTDLINLRALKSILVSKQLAPETSPELLSTLMQQRKKARQAKRAILMRLTHRHLKELLQQISPRTMYVSVRVFGVIKKGLLVFIENLGIQALLPFDSLEKAAHCRLFMDAQKVASIKTDQGKTYSLDGLSFVGIISSSGVQRNQISVSYAAGFESAPFFNKEIAEGQRQTNVFKKEIAIRKEKPAEDRKKILAFQPKTYESGLQSDKDLSADKVKNLLDHALLCEPTLTE